MVHNILRGRGVPVVATSGSRPYCRTIGTVPSGPWCSSALMGCGVKVVSLELEFVVAARAIMFGSSGGAAIASSSTCEFTGTQSMMEPSLPFVVWTGNCDMKPWSCTGSAAHRPGKATKKRQCDRMLYYRIIVLLWFSNLSHTWRYFQRGEHLVIVHGEFWVGLVETSHEPYSLKVLRIRHGMRTMGRQLASVR